MVLKQHLQTLLNIYNNGQINNRTRTSCFIQKETRTKYALKSMLSGTILGNLERQKSTVVFAQHPINIALTGKSTLYKLRSGQI